MLLRVSIERWGLRMVSNRRGGGGAEPGGQAEKQLVVAVGHYAIVEVYESPLYNLPKLSPIDSFLATVHP